MIMPAASPSSCATGAEVVAMPTSAAAMNAGTPGQRIHSSASCSHILRSPPCAASPTVRDCRAGAISLTAHLTAGHTAGGTTWTWKSCEREQCFDFVYADSQTPVSADNFYYTKSTTYPTGISDFQHGLMCSSGCHAMS